MYHCHTVDYVCAFIKASSVKNGIPKTYGNTIKIANKQQSKSHSRSNDCM